MERVGEGGGERGGDGVHRSLAKIIKVILVHVLNLAFHQNEQILTKKGIHSTFLKDSIAHTHLWTLEVLFHIKTTVRVTYIKLPQ